MPETVGPAAPRGQAGRHGQGPSASFAEFDTDGDGSISVEEFTEMMIKLGLAPPKEPGKESASRAKIDEGA